MLPIFLTIIHNLSFVFHCLLSVVLGGAIGFERELKRKPAGFKTHVMITLGATIITYLSMNMPNADPSRIAAQIVSGIGFIGAGTIMQSRQVIQGLTTAATVWVVGGIGMLVGAGMWLPAVNATILISGLLIFSDRFTRGNGSTFRSYTLNLQVETIKSLARIDQLLDHLDVVVEHKTLTKTDDVINLQINYSTTAATQFFFMRKLNRLSGIAEMVEF